MDKGLFEASEEGTPQGGPLSPLLSNIMLNELDKELERRGLPFVRYADDSMIFCKSKRAAMRVKESITRFIENTLYLKVNYCCPLKLKMVKTSYPKPCKIGLRAYSFKK